MGDYMNNSKGFTLVELLGTIVILGIIALITTPPIINQIKNAKTKVSTASVSYLYSAGESYVKENLNSYPMTTNSVICVSITKLVDNGNIKDSYIKEHDIDASSAVKFIVNAQSKLVGDSSLFNSTCTTKLKISLSS